MASSIPPNNTIKKGACLPCMTQYGQPQQNTSSIYTQALPKNSLDTDNGMKQTEDLLASEMSKLSVQQRSKALDDVHCVGEALKETPEMVQKSLASFDLAVGKQHKNYPIYL